MIKTLNMKKLINILLVFTFSCTLWSQECENALPMNVSEKTFPPTYDCQTGSNIFFTYIFCDSILKNSVDINIVSYKKNGIGDGFTVQVYGPYNSVQEGCAVLNSSSHSDSISNENYLGSQSVLLSPKNWSINQFYILKVEFTSCLNGLRMNKINSDPHAPNPPSIRNGEWCQECLPRFSPSEGKYIVTAWVKEKDASVYTVNYVNSKVEIYNNSSLINQFYPIGSIIDGWQKIEGIFELVGNPNFFLKLVTTDGVTAYFDDVRVQPFNSSMITYVYDPLTLRLVAELDERNYAKLYEYDEQGKLIRIKKETEKGIMTIQENRNNIKKR